MRLNGGKPSPSSLAKKIDWELTPGDSEQNNVLMESITVDLACGWASEAKPGTNFKKYINVCLCRFKEGQRENRKQLRRVSSVSSRRSKSPMRTSGKEALPGIQRVSTNGSMNENIESMMASATRSCSTGALPGFQRTSTNGSANSVRPRGPSKSPMRSSIGKGLQRFGTDESIKKRSKSLGSNSLLQRAKSAMAVTAAPLSPRRSQRNLFPRNSSRRSLSPITVLSDQMEKTEQDGAKSCAKYWRRAQDPETGKTYYYNKITKETLWKKPKQMKEYEKSQSTIAKAG